MQQRLHNIHITHIASMVHASILFLANQSSDESTHLVHLVNIDIGVAVEQMEQLGLVHTNTFHKDIATILCHHTPWTEKTVV